MSTKQTSTVSIAPTFTSFSRLSRSRLPLIKRPRLRTGRQRRGECRPGEEGSGVARRTPRFGEPGARIPVRQVPISRVAIGWAGLLHGGDVVLEDLDHPGVPLALGRDLVPECERRTFDRGPLRLRDRGQLELAARRPVVRLAPP